MHSTFPKNLESISEELSRKSEQYQNLFKHANDAIFIIEPEDETVLNANDKACEMYGFELEDFIGLSLKSISKDVRHGDEQRQKLLEIGTCQEFETVQFRCDGMPINLHINAAVIEYEGRPAILSINRDITKRIQTEQSLKEREQHLLSVANAAQDAIVSADNHGNINFWNEGARRIFGYCAEEVAGKSLAILMPERYREMHAKGMRRYTETGEKRVIGKAVELHGLRKDGSEFPLELSLGVWETADGKNFTGILRDITERRKSEQIQLSRAREVALRAEIGLIFSASGESLKTNLKHCAEAIVNHLDTALARIWTFNEAENVLELQASAGIYTHLDETHHRVPIGQFKIGLIAQEREPHVTNNVSGDADVVDKEWAKENNLVSFAGYPLVTDGRLIGVAEMFARHEFEAETRDALANISDTITQNIERKQAEADLRASEYKLRTLVTSMNEGMLQVDEEDSIVYVNNYFCQMVGYAKDELIGKNWSRLLLDNEGNDFIREVNKRRRKGVSDRYELRLKKKSGETLYVLVSGVPVHDAESVIIGSMGVFTDITERKRIEEQLQHDAFHDGLTGLANRALFMHHLRLTIERGKSRLSNSYAVLFLDFDRFKMINDSLGHAVGDHLLKLIAKRLESATRTGDLVARLGGDEFVVLLSELAEEVDAVQIAERIQAGLKTSFDLSGNEVFISASIGIALSASGHESAEDMVRDADIAMYRAKAKGKARYQIFDQAMHEQASKQLTLETEMRRALESGEFLLHYQPIINLETEALTGFEALVRWQHPEHGMIPPVEFIPAAEENGLILPLGNWILEESCRQLHRWHNEYPAASNLTVSVNLSCKQFVQPDLAEQIARTIQKTGLNPRRLKLEITESHIMDNTEAAVTMMNKLRDIGVELSLDDFGTGYSSLSYLHRLPVNYLKIDRSFVIRMIDSKENSEIVHTIIKLAQSLKMRVVAEGIETAEQLQHLKDLNCEFGQGFFFSKPLPDEAAKTFIETSNRSPAFMLNQPVINVELNV